MENPVEWTRYGDETFPLSFCAWSVGVFSSILWNINWLNGVEVFGHVIKIPTKLILEKAYSFEDCIMVDVDVADLESMRQVCIEFFYCIPVTWDDSLIYNLTLSECDKAGLVEGKRAVVTLALVESLCHEAICRWQVAILYQIRLYGMRIFAFPDYEWGLSAFRRTHVYVSLEWATLKSWRFYVDDGVLEVEQGDEG